MKPRVTIKTIAEKAGVSIGAVSQILATPDHPRFSAETKKRIMKIVKELNYRPNRFAVGLRRQQVHLIVLIVPWNCPELVDTIERTARMKNYQVMISQTPEPAEDVEIKALQSALDWQPDGIIWLPYGEAENYEDIIPQIRSWGGKIVFLHHGLSNLDDMDIVKPEGVKVIRQAIEHLFEQGYEKVVHVGVPSTFELDRIRINAVKLSAQEFGLEFDRIEIDTTNERAQFHKYLSSLGKPTGFICQGDWYAVEILELTEEISGLNCPNDVGIVSIGDFLLGNRLRICQITRPKISAVQEPFRDISEKAVELLMGRLKGTLTLSPQYIEVPERFVIRQSTLRKGE